MAVVLVSSQERDNGMTEVVLSDDGVRFRAMVSTALMKSGDAYNSLQIIANRQKAEHARLGGIRKLVTGDDRGDAGL